MDNTFSFRLAISAGLFNLACGVNREEMRSMWRAGLIYYNSEYTGRTVNVKGHGVTIYTSMAAMYDTPSILYKLILDQCCSY